MADNLGKTFPFIFLVLFCMLAASVIILIKKLRAKNKQLVMDDAADNYFRKEINTLIVILVLFSISYLLRVIYDAYIGFDDSDGDYRSYVIGSVTGIPFDLLPIVAVLLFHRHNLRQIGA